MMDLFITNMKSQDVKRWTGLVWIIVMFYISCLDSHSDGTHSLQSIHESASDVMLHFSKSVLMRNKLIHILDSLRASTF